jgi:hypothetical protein
MKTQDKKIELDDRTKVIIDCVNKSTREMMEILHKNMSGFEEKIEDFSINDLLEFNASVITLFCSAIIGMLNSSIINAGGKFDISLFIHYMGESIKDTMGVAKQIKKTPKNMNKMDKNLIITF